MKIQLLGATSTATGANYPYASRMLLDCGLFHGASRIANCVVSRHAVRHAGNQNGMGVSLRAAVGSMLTARVLTMPRRGRWWHGAAPMHVLSRVSSAAGCALPACWRD